MDNFLGCFTPGRGSGCDLTYYKYWGDTAMSSKFLAQARLLMTWYFSHPFNCMKTPFQMILGCGQLTQWLATLLSLEFPHILSVCLKLKCLHGSWVLKRLSFLLHIHVTDPVCDWPLILQSLEGLEKQFDTYITEYYTLVLNEDDLRSLCKVSLPILLYSIYHLTTRIIYIYASHNF